MTDLEVKIRELLDREVAVAPMPLTIDELLRHGSTTDLVPAGQSGRTGGRRGVGLIGAAATVAAGVAGIAAIGVRRSDEAATQFQPDGVQVQITALDVMEPPPVGVIVKPGSLTRYQVDGHPSIERFTTVLFYEGHVVQARCVDGGCAVIQGAEPVDVGQTSAVDNGEAFADLFEWSGLPEHTSVVQFVDGSGSPSWQYPIDGLVAFPMNSPDPDAYALAYDLDGTVVADSRALPPAPDLEPFDMDRYRRLSDEARDELWSTVTGSMANCTPVLDWESCVSRADGELAVWLDRNAK